MRLYSYVVAATAFAGLSACETTVEEKVVLEPAPEFMACQKVPSELAIADANVKRLGTYDTMGAYWSKRSERLVARYYACSKLRKLR